jgi:periodic tryptophan protein 1
LLSGGYDRLINVVDVRERPIGNNAIRYKLPKEAKDIESANWHPTLEHNFAISTEAGYVYGYDIRKSDGPMFSIKAHEKACSSLSFSPHISNMMATCSVDEHVKIWDIANSNGTQPKLIGYKKMQGGELFSL